MKQTLYAFWKYDLCPYMLGGIVTFMYPDGRVAVQGYDGFMFKPLAILPDEAGAKALKDLKQLGIDYRERDKQLRESYRAMAHRLVGLEGEQSEQPS